MNSNKINYNKVINELNLIFSYFIQHFNTTGFVYDDLKITFRISEDWLILLDKRFEIKTYELDEHEDWDKYW